MRKKSILWGLGSLFIMILAILLIVPVFIDSSSLKQKIQAAVVRKNIGTLDYQKANLVFVPLPHLTIQKIDFTAPNQVTAGVETMKVYPELLPLFRGKLRLSKIVLDSPVFTLTLSGKQGKKTDAGKETAPFNPVDSLAAVLAPLSDYTSGLKVAIDQGNFKINQGAGQKFVIKDLDLEARLTITGPRSFNGQIGIDGALLTVKQDDQAVMVDCDGLQATLSVDADQARLDLNQLDLAQPALKISGQFIASPDKPEFSFDLKGKDLDVDAVRAAALTLGGDDAMVRDIFSYVQGGRIPMIQVTSMAKSMAMLGDMKNLIIRGRMRNGDISIDDIGMKLSEVDGEVLISKGLLEVFGASARSGETTGRDGTLKIGLAEDNDRFALDILLNAELNQVPATLKKIIGHKAFTGELALIKNIEGRGKARLVMGERLSDIKTRLEIAEINFTADYQRVPFPIKINGAKLLFEESRVSVEALGGNVGRSVFKDTDCTVDWENGLTVDIPTGQLNLVLEEIYPWVSSVEELREGLSDIKKVTGDLKVSAFTLKYSPEIDSSSGAWQLSGDAEFKNVSVGIKDIPEPLYLSSGNIQVTPDQLAFNHVNAQLMDAQCSLTGTVQGNFRKPDRVNASLNGGLGKKTVHFLLESGHLRKAYALQAPVQFSNTEIIWQSPDDFSLKGNLLFPEGVAIVTDFHYQPGKIAVNRLDIKDADSAMTCALGWRKDKINLLFNGNLNHKTLGRIFAAEKLFDGWLKGDMQLAFAKGNLSESILKGRLEGGAFKMPVGDKPPLSIEKFLFSAGNNRITVDHLALSWMGNEAKLNGQVDMTADAFVLHLDASAGDLKWEGSEKTAGPPAKGSQNNSKLELWKYPVSGTINLTATSFSLGHYKWQPVHAQFSLDPGRVNIDVRKASLCGIDTIGTLLWEGSTLDLNFQCIATDQDFISTYECLNKNQVEMTGVYDLSGQISARGPADALLPSARGEFGFNARNGVITKDKRLSRILEVVNFTEIVKGKIPDLRSKGFSYKTITIQGNVENNRVIFNKIFMDGKTLDLLGKGTLDLKKGLLDVELLAAPFKTVDTAIKHIPGVNYLMAGSLVSVPVRIRGDSADPKVTLMSASDISSGFLDFAERAIKSPVKLIQYWNPFKKR